MFFLALCFRPQMLAQFHQQLTKPVFTCPISPVTPIAVVGGVLDELSLARVEQHGFEGRMLLKFGPHSLPHNIVLHRFPILPQRSLAASTHACRNHGGFGLPDCLFMRGVSKLLSLKIMLGSRPHPALQLDWMWGKVRKFAIGLS